jgi:hypothetical protein
MNDSIIKKSSGNSSRWHMLSIIPIASMNTDEMMDMAEEWFMDI